MSAAVYADTFLTEKEYLATEPASAVKREYLGGYVYAMAGASEAHSIIAMNLAGLLYNQLLRGPCQAFGSDMKLRLEWKGDTYFYYPDMMVACDGGATRPEGICERPSVIIEILSASTRHTDMREKRLAYGHVPGLRAYVRIEQRRAEVIVEPRDPTTEGWRPAERLEGTDAVARVPVRAGITLKLPLVDLYDRISFPASRGRS